MANIAVFMAEGFEEIELTTIVNILRRAGINALTVGIIEGITTGARKMNMIPDTSIDQIEADDFDMIVLPGGLPGANYLNDDPRVKELIQNFNKKNKAIGAICAAPYVLANAGVLNGKKATSYPAPKHENLILSKGGTYLQEKVVKDGNIITSRGPATAMCFALSIVENFKGSEISEQVRKALLLPEDYCR